MVVLEKQVIMDKDIRLDKSDHVFIHYFRDDEIMYDGATEASFEFHLEVVDRDTSAIVRKYKVKKCGVRMLYPQEADEFIMREHVLCVSDVEEPHNHGNFS